ncbi:AAA family ATPase [Paraburkholderia jirisanensis]
MASHYDMDEQLVRHSRIALYRATAGAAKRLIAVGSPGVFTTVHVEAFRHEYALRSELNGEWAVLPLSPTRYEDQPSLLLGDPGGQLLRNLCGVPMALEQFLPLAVAIASAVAQMHACGLIHLGISPDNLLVEIGRTGVSHAWLTGFGSAQRIQDSKSATRTHIPAEPEAFAYLSPEQLGMSHPSVDARADLYALGCTFYELLSGTPPFTAEDPIGWAHAHTAQWPINIRAGRPSIPHQIGAIIGKLLKKAPEERYYSAASLGADLERCLSTWRQHGAVDRFPLNLHDIASRLSQSRKLYARGRELQRLAVATDDVNHGAARCVLLRGAAGSGKSSLANRHLSRLSPERHWLAISKCEPAMQGVPYAGLARALEYLIRPLLGASDVELERWRTRLQSALDGQGRVLLPFVPALERIVGIQPALPQLTSTEEKDRLIRVVTSLFRVLASAEQTIVLFFDDLHWSDDGTLRVFEYLASRASVPHLLVIGSLRDDGVVAQHLTDTVASQQGVDCIALQPFTVPDVAALLSDLLHDDQHHVAALASLITSKTYGNPYFTIQFILALAQEGLVAFRSDGTCAWELAPIKAKGYTTNVVDLLLGQIRLLPVRCRKTMHLLSCLGRSAHVDVLAQVANVSNERIYGMLAPALDAKLVQRLDDVYSFAHDRILETAYLTLADEAKRGATHLQIGRRLGKALSTAHREHQLFEVVSHLNRGARLIDDPQERHELAALNLEAGLLAKGATAYGEALTYLRCAVEMLSGAAQVNEAELQTAELHLAECEFINGHLDEANLRLSLLAERGVDLACAAEIARLRVALCTARDRSDLAVGIGLMYLRKAGIEIPAHPTEAEVIGQYQRLLARIGERPLDAFRDQPEMRDPVWQRTLQVLADLIPPALFTSPNLPNLIALHMAHISFEHGVSDASCYGYICVSEVARRADDFRMCVAFAELGLHLVDVRGFARYKARVHMLFGLVQSWTRPVRDALPYLRMAFDEAMQAGDITFAAYCRRNLISPMLVYGAPLAEVRQLAYESLAFARGTGFALVIDAIRAQISYVDTLRGARPNSAWWTDDEADEHTHRPISVFSYWTHRMQAHLIFGNLAAAVDAQSRIAGLVWASSGHYETGIFVLFSALVHAAACGASKGRARTRHLAQLNTYAQQLDAWARHAPANFRDGATLVAAEIARIERRVADAIRLYDQAIEYAREQQFLHNEALASELAAQFHLGLGAKTSAHAYLRGARQAYLAWGADAKVGQLDLAYPDLVTSQEHDGPAGLESQLDIAAVIIATRALSRETLLTRLIETLLRCTLEYAGGQRCVLVAIHGNELGIEAEAQVRGHTVNVQMCSRVVAPTDVPLALLRTVIRTGELMVLGDAQTAREWSGDLYMREVQPRSVLCLPLLNQSRMVGLLYAENNLAPNAFTPERTAVLSVLSTHAAISLENARVSERLQTAQAELARAGRLTAMGELVASIVHEVNQPLTAANTGAHAALRWLKRDQPDVAEALYTLDRVAADTTRAANIIRGLLSLAKKTAPEKQCFDLNESVREVLQLLRREIAHHEIDIDDRAIAGELKAYGDRVQLQQVVMNLVMNAIDAMSDSPAVLRKLRLASAPCVDGRIRVTVADNGPGIDATVMGKVFEPFVTTKSTGMGMGLSICRSIVEAHGGDLIVSANEPHGACFEFIIAAADERRAAGRA